MNRIKKAMASILSASIVLTGVMALGNMTAQPVYAVYEKEFGYDPDAIPNLEAVHDLDSLREEILRLKRHSVCRIGVGCFGDEGAFGIAPPRSPTFPDKVYDKWVIYKTEERAAYDVVAMYSDEGIACRVFLQALQQRARERRSVFYWDWYPCMDDIIEK